MARSRGNYEPHKPARERRFAPVAAPAPPVASLLALQASAGNQAVARMLARRPRNRPEQPAEPAPVPAPAPAAQPAPVPAPAPAAAAEAPPAPAPPLIPSVTVKAQRETREFAACEDARQWAGDNLGQNNYETKIADQRSLTVTVGERDGQVTASAMLDFRIDPDTSYTRVVVPTWPDMTPDEKQQVDEYVKAMQAHEDGHIAVGEQAYVTMSGVVEGIGTTAEEAKADRRTKADEKLQATAAYAAYARDEYDALTDHGRKQSAVGGRDTVLNCPPRP
jgi:Bacterial protein of unknown function (DUF922)